MKPPRRILRIIGGILLLLAVLLIGGKIVVSRIAASPPKEVELLSGIVFGRGGEQELKLDITRPRSFSGKLPVLLCIHGGGWTGGSREDLRAVMYGFSKAGFLCASVDYRLTPKDRFPAQVEDVKCATRWLRAHAGEYQIDPDRLAAFGLSAGAHLSAFLATTAGVAEFEGSGGNPEQSSAVRAAICLAGPYDLALGYRSSSGRQRPAEGETVRKLLTSFLGGSPDEVPAVYARASPLTHASKTSAPMLLVHGDADPLVLVEQAEVFSAKLQEAGASVQFLRLPDGTHNSFGRDQEKALKSITTFAREQLQVGAK